jgi:hypothetical protein
MLKTKRAISLLVALSQSPLFSRAGRNDFYLRAGLSFSARPSGGIHASEHYLRVKPFNATLCGDTAGGFRHYRWPSRPIRAAPIPRPRRPDHKSLQAEATTCRDPGSLECPGSFFVTVKALFPKRADFAGMCDTPATLAKYSIAGRTMTGTDDIILD